MAYINDPNAYALTSSIRQSKGTAKYMLDPVYTNVQHPMRVNSIGFNTRAGVSLASQRHLVDVESDLKLLNFPASSDPHVKYRPVCSQCGTVIKKGRPGSSICRGCYAGADHLKSFNFPTQWSRLYNPICSAREKGVNRWQPIALNPQNITRWSFFDYKGTGSRNDDKDRNVTCMPKMLDQTSCLPGKDRALSPRTTHGAHTYPKSMF
jgi:hypothetical protein